MRSASKLPMRSTQTRLLPRNEIRRQPNGIGGNAGNIGVVAAGDPLTGNPRKSYDPVQVFCRIRPLANEGDMSCVRLKNANTVILSTTEQIICHKHIGTGVGPQKEIQYVFKHVFEGTATQRDVFTTVAQPLVQNLINGRNSLLFTYGVTGSGKTFTMAGDIKHRGVMPRCLDLLFQTIGDFQTNKFVFKPDRLNNFEILSEADAMLERQQEMNQRFKSSLKRQISDIEIASQASTDVSPLPGLDEDNMYAVFITYVEIYNNSVYDLLEDTCTQKLPQSKIIREDANNNMFVHGVTEIEIKSVEEALEAYQKGQKRKRMGHTVLNAESSRSHSIFNIRLVQSPSDHIGENIIQDKRVITISQLSLVDLAGSERSSRTKNTGVRLREACNINNSLLTLRTCLDYLRENQSSVGDGKKKIPYRDSKLTHIFKSYFEGEGQVSMIVCINPRAEDYDENIHVLKFAEITQEVQIARATLFKSDLGLTPGRRKANKMFKMAANNLNDLGHTEAKKLEVDLGLVYSLGPGFPEYKFDSDEGAAMQQLMQYLLQRIEKRKILSSHLDDKCKEFRTFLLEKEKENITLRTELASTRAVYQQERDRSFALENKIRLQESSINILNNKLENRERQIDDLTRKLRTQQQLLSKKDLEKEYQRKKFDSQLAVEVTKQNRMHELKHAKLQNKLRAKDEKLHLLSNIIQSEGLPGQLYKEKSNENLLEMVPSQKSIAANTNEPMIPNAVSAITATSNIVTNTNNIRPSSSRVTRGAAVANKRHRRSRSAGDKWIEHRAPNPVPLGTVLQPYLINRKSVTKLNGAKDITGNNASKYVLVSQEADTDGDVETKLFKGNIIPTSGGGAQVIFNDVECLVQKSPTSSPIRRRTNISSTGLDGGVSTQNMNGNINTGTNASIFSALQSTNSAHEVATRCNLGIEGHTGTMSALMGIQLRNKANAEFVYRSHCKSNKISVDIQINKENRKPI